MNEDPSAIQDESASQARRPPSSLHGAQVNLITTGAYTVEHAGGTCATPDDSHSYGTNIDFLNHFGGVTSGTLTHDQISQMRIPSR